MSVIFACSLFLTTSCRQKSHNAAAPSVDSSAIASVEGNVIGVEDYRVRLKERCVRAGVQPSNSDKDALLEERVRFEAVYARARAVRFDQRPEIAALIKNLVVSHFIEQEMDTAKSATTDEEIRKYYEEHRPEFVVPATARGALIFLRAGARISSEKRDEIRQRAGALLAEARQTKGDAGFASLVQRHSEDQATRYRGGDLGWLTRAQCEAAFGVEVAASLFALREPEEFATLVEVPGGFYILRLVERKEARARSLAEVEPLIHYQLDHQRKFEHEQAFYKRMKEGLDIQINRPLLESISVPLSDPPPPVLPGSVSHKGS